MKQDASTLRAHIIPRIGNLVASQVNVAALLVFVDKLKAAGLSASTIRNILSVVRCLFDVSAARQLAPIVVNPTRDPVFIRQGRPKRTRSPKVQVAIEVVEKVLTHAEVPEHWKLRILIACTGGLRDGEIAGLQWKHVDLEADVPVLHIEQAVALVCEKGKTAQIGPTKTSGSVRDVPVHPETVKALKAWKASGFVEWTGHHAKPEDFVLPSEDGSAWRPRSADALRRFLLLAECDDKCAGKPIDFHALRRSFATWLARAGVERAVRKKLMGHTEGGDVTEDFYIERDLPMLRDAVCRIRLDLTRGRVIEMPMKAVAR